MQRNYDKPDMAEYDRALVGAFLPDQQGRVELCTFGTHSTQCKQNTQETVEFLQK